MLKDFPKPQIEEDNFFDVINEAILDNRHVDYLKDVIVNYKKYKDFFEKEAFCSYNPRNYVYRFKVVYKQDSKVWRLIELKGSQTLEDLADEIISSMFWMNDHMHRFAFPDKSLKSYQFANSRYEIFYDAEGWGDDPFPTLKTNQVRIDDIDYEKFPKLYFEFDFGDSHEFMIEMKLIRGPKRHEVKASFPRMIKEIGDPPEQYPSHDDEELGDEDLENFVPIEEDESFQEFARLIKITKFSKADQLDKNTIIEYLNFHDKLPKTITKKHISDAILTLQSKENNLELKKYAILILAHSGVKESLETLQKYQKTAEGELEFWIHQAIGECQLFMESDN